MSMIIEDDQIRAQVEALRLGCERVLRLVDLTVGLELRPALRRELLRWRELLAELSESQEASPERHEALFRVLLQLRPGPYRQLPLLLESPPVRTEDFRRGDSYRRDNTSG